MSRDVDIAVVGGGITGIATTRALAQRGYDVVLLERFAFGHRRGSSHGASRIFRLNYADTRYVQLAQRALEGWRALEMDARTTLIDRAGVLDLGEPALANARALEACAAAFEVLDGAEVARRWPLHAEHDEIALFQPDGGTLLADRAWQALADSAIEAGAVLRAEHGVERIERLNDGVRIAGNRLDLTACAVVVTCGGWGPQLLSPLAIDLLVEPTRESVVYLALGTVAGLPPLIDYASPELRALSGHDRPGQAAYALPAPGVGLKAGLHHAGPVTDPDEDPAPDEGLVAAATHWARRRFVDCGDPLDAETCIYTNTPDESFVLERHGRVVVGSACSGHGFKFAPEIGRLLAAHAIDALRS